MYLFEYETTLEAEPAAVWAVWTDVARWPEWDVSKEIARLDGPFGPGVSGWAKQRGNLGGSFTVTEVDAGRHWVSECPVPLGKVVFDHTLEPAGQGRVRVVKRVEVEGGIAPLLRMFAPKMRRDVAESLAALGRIAATRPSTQLHDQLPADLQVAARRSPIVSGTGGCNRLDLLVGGNVAAGEVEVALRAGLASASQLIQRVIQFPLGPALAV